jgi:hypothetical protein
VQPPASKVQLAGKQVPPAKGKQVPPAKGKQVPPAKGKQVPPAKGTTASSTPSATKGPAVKAQPPPKNAAKAPPPRKCVRELSDWAQCGGATGPCSSLLSPAVSFCNDVQWSDRCCKSGSSCFRR